MKNLLLFSGLFLLLFSCSSSKEVDISNISLETKVIRTDKEVVRIQSKKDVVAFLEAHPDFKAYLLHSIFPNDSIMIRELSARFTHPEFKAFVQEVQSEFKSLPILIDSLEMGMKHIKYFYPEYIAPNIQTMITGFLGVDLLYMQDTTTLTIGLDYFVNDKSGYKRPMQMPQYLLEDYAQQNIITKTMMLECNKFVEVNKKDQSVIAYMIDYGKVLYFMHRCLPTIPEYRLIEYSKAEWEKSINNQHLTWKHFVENKLLFSKDREIVQKYIEERPQVYEIGKDAPGMIGRFIGYQIVKSYMENNEEVTLQKLLANPNAQEIFQKSGYKPAP